jgi:ATP-dependent protease ClpP protease subunit
VARRTRHEALITALLARRPLASRYAPRERDADGRTWYRIENRDAAAAAPVEVYLYAEIGMWGVTADMFLDELAPLGSRDITLRINSEGGEVFDGVAIYNALQRHGGRITAHVDGLAASAASFISMAADEIVMEPGAQMMIHDAIGMCYGNEAEMERMRDMLARTSDTIAMIYAERAGGDSAAWREVMRGERWYDGAAAVAAKLADRVGEGRARDVRQSNRPSVNLPVNYDESQLRDPNTGRWIDGMPEVIAEYAVPTLSGTLSARSVRGGVALDDGSGRDAVVFTPRETDRLMRAMRNEYATAGETVINRNTEIDGKLHVVTVARVRPHGAGVNEDGETVRAGVRLDVGAVEDSDDYDARQGVVLTSRQAGQQFADAIISAEAATRVDTGYGPLDMYPAQGGGVGLRMKADSGLPTEVEFSKAEWTKINKAIDTLIDGYDADGPDDGPEVNSIIVTTKAGKVELEWKGGRQDGGYADDARLLMTPLYDAPWSVVVGGEHMSATFDPIGNINEVIGVSNRVAHAGLPIAWADPPAAAPDDWADALVALTTPEPVSSLADDQFVAFWEANA